MIFVYESLDFKSVSFDDTHLKCIYGIRTGLSKNVRPFPI